MFNKELRKAFVGQLLAVSMVGAVMPRNTVSDAQAAVVSEAFQMTGMSVEAASPQMQGTKLTISAFCSGGSGDYTYTYRVKRPDGSDETIAKDISSDRVTYTVEDIGIYNFEVQVSDGMDVYSDIQEFVVTPSKVTISKFQTDRANYKKKDVVRFKVGATAAWGTEVKSKIVLQTPGGKVTVKKYSKVATAMYKVKKKGTYQATVTVKDEKTTANKTISFTVK